MSGGSVRVTSRTRLGPAEPITEQALAAMVGQAAPYTVAGQVVGLARVSSAALEDDWIVLGLDLEHGASRGADRLPSPSQTEHGCTIGAPELRR